MGPGVDKHTGVAPREGGQPPEGEGVAGRRPCPPIQGQVPRDPISASLGTGGIPRDDIWSGDPLDTAPGTGAFAGLEMLGSRGMCNFSRATRRPSLRTSWAPARDRRLASGLRGKEKGPPFRGSPVKGSVSDPTWKALGAAFEFCQLSHQAALAPGRIAAVDGALGGGTIQLLGGHAHSRDGSLAVLAVHGEAGALYECAGACAPGFIAQMPLLILADALLGRCSVCQFNLLNASSKQLCILSCPTWCVQGQVGESRRARGLLIRYEPHRMLAMSPSNTDAYRTRWI